MIQVALYRPVYWIDKTICFFSRGDYSHASIVLSDGSVIEAKPFDNVHHVSSVVFNRVKGSIIELYDLNMDESQEKILVDFLNAQIGKKYDFPSVLGIILDASREGRKQRAKWFCSELVFAALEKAGILLLERTFHWKVTPVMLSLSNVLKFNKKIIVGEEA